MMNQRWLAWREGYLGAWSLAHLSDGVMTRCGLQVSDGAVKVPKVCVRCAECERLAAGDVKAEQKGGGLMEHKTEIRLDAEDNEFYYHCLCGAYGRLRTNRTVASQDANLHVVTAERDQLRAELESRPCVLRRDDGSFSVYYPRGQAHMVLIDSLDLRNAHARNVDLQRDLEQAESERDQLRDLAAKLAAALERIKHLAIAYDNPAYEDRNYYRNQETLNKIILECETEALRAAGLLSEQKGGK